MTITPLLFSGIKKTSPQQNRGSFVDDLGRVLNRGRGLHTIFDLASNAFSWGKVIGHPGLKGYFSQGNQITQLCYSAYGFTRMPGLFLQSVGMWNKGKGAVKASVNFQKQSSLCNQVNWLQVSGLAKNYFALMVEFFSWGCSTLKYINKVFRCAFPQQVLNVIERVGIVSSISLFGVWTFNSAQLLAKRVSLPDAKSPLLQQVRRVMNRSILCKMLSSGAVALSLLGKGINLFFPLLVPSVCSLAFSTISVLFRIRSVYLENQIHLTAKRRLAPV